MMDDLLMSSTDDEPAPDTEFSLQFPPVMLYKKTNN